MLKGLLLSIFSVIDGMLKGLLLSIFSVIDDNKSSIKSEISPENGTMEFCCYSLPPDISGILIICNILSNCRC